MEKSIHIRPVTFNDVPAIVRIHSGEEDPWAEPATCALWVNHRLLRPFICELAVIDGKAAGHAEWNVSIEPPPIGHQLYLSLLQVHPDVRNQGIGLEMVKHGLRNAKQLGCECLRTIPEDDVTDFYQKYGLVPERKIETYRIPVRSNKLPENWKLLNKIPKQVIGKLPMRLGIVQASSAFMWEICNRPIIIADDPAVYPCAARSDGQAYVQLEHWRHDKCACVICWSSEKASGTEIIDVANALGTLIGVQELIVVGYADDIQGTGSMGKCEKITFSWSTRIL